jgi:hypothetical protein
MEDSIKKQLDELYVERDKLEAYDSGKKVYVQETNGLSLNDKILINKSKIEVLESLLV